MFCGPLGKTTVMTVLIIRRGFTPQTNYCQVVVGVLVNSARQSLCQVWEIHLPAVASSSTMWMWESCVISWFLSSFICPMSPWHQSSLPNLTIEMLNQRRKVPPLLTLSLTWLTHLYHWTPRQGRHQYHCFAGGELCSVVCELPHPNTDGLHLGPKSTITPTHDPDWMHKASPPVSFLQAPSSHLIPLGLQLFEKVSLASLP